MSTFLEVTLGISILLLCSALAYKHVSDAQLRNRILTWGQNWISICGAACGAGVAAAMIVTLVDNYESWQRRERERITEENRRAAAAR